MRPSGRVVNRRPSHVLDAGMRRKSIRSPLSTASSESPGDRQKIKRPERACDGHRPGEAATPKASSACSGEAGKSRPGLARIAVAERADSPYGGARDAERNSMRDQECTDGPTPLPA